jgi:hypothetical protein
MEEIPELQDLSLAEAASVATFPLLVPGVLPKGCKLSGTASVRVEQTPRTLGVTQPVWQSKRPLEEGELCATGWTSGGQPFWTTMRNCCVVYEIRDCVGQRLLRVKQYLFLDYGPHPTHHAMIPPVGNYKARVDQSPGPRLQFTVGDRACGWIGIDYAGFPCAQLMLRGACCEVRVKEGCFADEELVDLCSSLTPLQEVVAALQSPPEALARANYYSRHPSTMHGFLVPASLLAQDVSNFGLPQSAYPHWWAAEELGGEKPTPGDECPRFALVRVGSNRPERQQPRMRVPSSVNTQLPGGLCLDSFCILRGNCEAEATILQDLVSAAASAVETLALYVADGRDAMAWVRVVRAFGPCGETLRWPPELGSYPCELPLQERSIEGRTVYTAHVCKATGPHDAAFLEVGEHVPPNERPALVLVHATPRPGLNIEAFLQLVGTVMMQEMSPGP